MTARAVCSSLLCVALAGCGGGFVFVDGDFAVFGSWPRVTTSDTAQLNGTAFLPKGASCTYYPGPFAPPSCTCDAGPLAVGRWTNSGTGAAGTLELTIVSSASCVAVETVWRTPPIALAAGGNLISLSLVDGVSQGTASVTVVRN